MSQKIYVPADDDRNKYYWLRNTVTWTFASH